ncbi:MAG: response regulator transcription factor [Caulobacterales bacterium]
MIHIVDDDEAVAGMLATLARSAGLDAVAHTSGEAFLEAFEPRTAACVVIDAKLPGIGGLELQRALRSRGADTPVIVITGQGGVSMAVQALKAGAADFIEKPFSAEVFLASLRNAVALGRRALEEHRARADLAERAGQLSGREREVMELIAGGLANADAAAALGISVRTVESHRARIMVKMGARGLADLVRMWIRLTPPDGD